MKTPLSRIMRRILVALIPLLIIDHTLLFYGFLSNVVFYILLAIAFVAFLFMDWKNSLVLSCSLLGMTLIVNLMMGMVKIDDRIYYRDHERFVAYNYRLGADNYRRNVDVTLKEPFGDTYAVGGSKVVEPCPRTVRFRTDSLGFRNDAPYRGQKYVLVGDSFIVGNGSTQKDMVASQLKEKYGVDAYTLAYPGGIPDYVKFILYLERTYKTDFRVFLFLFEGNDFPDRYSRREVVMKKSLLKNLSETYRSIFKETVMYRYTFSLAASRKKGAFKAEVLTVKGHRLGEFDAYADAARRTSYTLPDKAFPLLSLVKDRIERIYFIPAKYRVYYPFLDAGKGNPLPNAQWEAVKALSEQLKIPCFDLTEPLIAESRALLAKDEFTFWKDDSHWNRNGMAVAARAVAEQIKSGK